MKTIFELISKVEIKEGKNVKKLKTEGKEGEFSTILKKMKKELDSQMDSSGDLKIRSDRTAKVEITDSGFKGVKKKDPQEDIQKILKKIEKFFENDGKAVSKDETREDVERDLFSQKVDSKDEGIERDKIDVKEKTEDIRKDAALKIQNQGIDDGEKSPKDNLLKISHMNSVKNDLKYKTGNFKSVEKTDELPKRKVDLKTDEEHRMVSESSKTTKPEGRVEKRAYVKVGMKTNKENYMRFQTTEMKNLDEKNIKKAEKFQDLKIVETEQIVKKQTKRMENGKVEGLFSSNVIRKSKLKDRRNLNQSVVVFSKSPPSKHNWKVEVVKPKPIKSESTKHDEKILKTQLSMNVSLNSSNTSEIDRKIKLKAPFKSENYISRIVHRKTRKMEIHIADKSEILEKEGYIPVSSDYVIRETNGKHEKISKDNILHQTQATIPVKNHVSGNTKKTNPEKISHRKFEFVEKEIEIAADEDIGKAKVFESASFNVRERDVELTQPIENRMETTNLIESPVQITAIDSEFPRKITKGETIDGIRAHVRSGKLSEMIKKIDGGTNVKRIGESMPLKISKDLLTIIRKNVERIVFKIERRESNNSNIKSTILLRSENPKTVERVSHFKGERFYEKIKIADVKDEGNIPEKIVSFTEKIPNDEEIKNSNIERMERIVESLSTKTKETKGVAQKAELTLRPPHLGKVEISVVEDDGKLKIEFKVATFEAKSEIEKNLDSLVVRLNNNGFEIDRVTVKLERENENYQEDKRSDDGWNDQDENQSDQRKRRQNRRNLNWKEGEME